MPDTAASCTSGELWLRATVAAELLGASERTVRREIRAGAYRGELHTGNGGSQYFVDLQSLPPEAQARYWFDQVKQQPASDRRAHLERLNLEESIEREVARAAGIKRRPEVIEPLPATHAEWEQKRAAFEALPRSMKEEAWRRSRALDQLQVLMIAGRPKMECFATVATDAEESTATIRRWHKRVRNQEQCDWHLFLAADYSRGGVPKAEIHPEAWKYVQREWLVQSKPTITAVVRRAVREARRQGWGTLPSIKTFKRRIEEEVPNTTVVFMREGDKALEALYPAQERDYSNVPVNSIWVSDGHKADLFVRFADGEKPARPILMFWNDIRTRKVLGWAVSKTENVPLVRASLLNAMTRSNAAPREFLLDNGRAYASKEITGGQPTRRRFKIKEDEMNGLATMLSIKVIWATPGHGQAKPIESFWRTITATARRGEFAGAYCGNKPDAKPEEFDAKNRAVPLAAYLAAVAEDIEAYNEREHRGDSMDGHSPNELYAELMLTTPVRTPTAKQIHLCMQAAENKSLDHDHGVTINGNRYWCEALAKLPTRGPFTFRYDPDNASAPVAVYDGELLIAEAPIYARTGFRDQEAAKSHGRARNQFKKAAKAQATALADQAKAASWEPTRSPTPIAPQAGEAPAPAAKVAELVRVRKGQPRVVTPDAPLVDADLADFERDRDEALRRDRAKRSEEPWPRRSAGAR